MPIMNAAQSTAARAIWLALAISILPGCATPPSRNFDAQTLWESTERRHSAAVQSIVERHQLEADYATIIRISRDSALRGRAFMRMAELHVALGEYGQARRNVEQALRATLPAEQRRQALLMLGDLMERHLHQKERAVTAYVQLVNEYPGAAETELAQLRLKVLNSEK